MTGRKEAHPTKEEGPRGFAVILQEIDDGALHAELGETLQKLSGDLVRYAENHRRTAKGKLTIEIALAASENGTLAVSADVKTKQPKEVRAGSVFWLTPGNNLSVTNPKQLALPVREVPRPESREVHPDGKAPVAL